MNKPLVSIITVSYNAVSTIEATINSIINQTYINIEYIIIDGGSNDGTIDIIKKYANKISYWTSEPDKGIYDAMNKGIQIAKGEWINFMNCGDSFYNSSVINDIFTKEISSDVIYGNTLLLLKNGNYIVGPKELKIMKKQLPFYHQSSFVKRKLMNKYLFDIKYKICADYNFFHQIWENNYTFNYQNIIISNYNLLIYSLSNNSHFKAYCEKQLIIEGNKNIKYYLKTGKYYIRIKIGKICSKLVSKHFLNRRREKQLSQHCTLLSKQ